MSLCGGRGRGRGGGRRSEWKGMGALGRVEVEGGCEMALGNRVVEGGGF